MLSAPKSHNRNRWRFPRVDGARSPEIPQKGGVLGSEIAARNRKSLATSHRTLKSQCSIAVSCLGNRTISGVRDGHRNRKSQKSLRFRCAKQILAKTCRQKCACVFFCFKPFVFAKERSQIWRRLVAKSVSLFQALHAPSSGPFLATDLAISVSLASVSVRLASV